MTDSSIIKRLELTPADNTFLKHIRLPNGGVVCSNAQRAKRLAEMLQNVKVLNDPWGPCVYVGLYKSKEVFIGAVPIGSGSGLYFTEFFVAGAKNIIRFGSDDTPLTYQGNRTLIRIATQADNLVGFMHDSGIAKDEWWQPIKASQKIVEAIKKEAYSKSIQYEEILCRHTENYFALRYPDKFGKIRSQRINSIFSSSDSIAYDMESAVLFQIARDFAQHAATILQTLQKDDPNLNSYEGHYRNEALNTEKKIGEIALEVLTGLD